MFRGEFLCSAFERTNTCFQTDLVETLSPLPCLDGLADGRGVQEGRLLMCKF
jgi:hypothetical protein